MIIGLPIWNGRISPVLDTAGRLRLVSVNEGCRESAREVPFDSPLVAARAGQLVDLGVDLLICGALSHPLALMIASSSIRMVPWISGDADEVLDAFLAGRLDGDQFAVPGSRGRGLHERRRHRHGSGGGCSWR